MKDMGALVKALMARTAGQEPWDSRLLAGHYHPGRPWPDAHRGGAGGLGRCLRAPC